MKLTQLEYFCVAARYHNITRASKELLLPSLRYLTRSKLWKKNSAWIFSIETIINWLWHRKVKSSIKMLKNFWLMRMLSDLNYTNSVSRLHLSASESRQCLEPFTCRICIFLWRKNSWRRFPPIWIWIDQSLWTCSGGETWPRDCQCRTVCDW